MAARDDYPNLARFEAGEHYDPIAARTEWHQMCAEVRTLTALAPRSESLTIIARGLDAIAPRLGIEGTN